MFKHPLYLVPFDFTPVSESAMRLALDLAEVNQGSVYLLHIVGKSSEKSDARNKFKETLDGLNEMEQKLTTTKVIVGDLFEDMGKAGDILKASLIVMGTHGAKGMQKIFGSNAVKMISNASSPFIITQGKKSIDKINTIVMPFSFSKESIQISTFAGRMAQKFNAKIHLVAHHAKDEWIEHKTQSNQLVVRKHFADVGVECEIVNLPGVSGYEKELLDYANSIDADVIAAAYYKEGILPSPNSFIQAMIENELQVPVLTVNAEELYVINSNYSFMSV
ncbi:MAG: nucleotide-binding universal stress UspA family protein [Crocinitomicaceae bacterium]|jgi:nucleotide-binding universal stress UspA family protein